MSSPKAKAYSITINGTTYLAFGLTKQGALNNLLAHLDGESKITVNLATGEQLYDAGKNNVDIIGEELYRRVVDKDQMPLPIDDTDTAGV